MQTDVNFWISLLIVLIAALSYILKKLDLTGTISGLVLAFTLLFGLGSLSLLPLLIFFVFGILFSRIGRSEKIRLGLYESKKGRRNWQNVVSNSLFAFLCGVLGLINPEFEPSLLIGVYAVFSSAFGDTTSSELGNIFGSKYVMITNGKSAAKGKDGAISLEGTILGFASSGIITVSAFFAGFNNFECFWIFLCGVVGNVSDSLLGATLQQQGKINNHDVNLLSTSIAGLIGVLGSLLF